MAYQLTEDYQYWTPTVNECRCDQDFGILADVRMFGNTVIEGRIMGCHRGPNHIAPITRRVLRAQVRKALSEVEA